MKNALSESARRPVNVSIAADVLADAKDLEINVSRAAEAGIKAEISRIKGERWLAENREAIESSNAYIREHGLPLEKYRMF